MGEVQRSGFAHAVTSFVVSGMLDDPRESVSCRRTNARFWFIPGLVCPEMGSAGQKHRSRKQSFLAAWPKSFGVLLENSAKAGSAVFGKIVSVLVCLIAYLTQQ